MSRTAVPRPVNTGDLERSSRTASRTGAVPPCLASGARGGMRPEMAPRKKEVTKGYRGSPWVTVGYRGLPRITADYRGVTEGYRGLAPNGRSDSGRRGWGAVVRDTRPGVWTGYGATESPQGFVVPIGANGCD